MKLKFSARKLAFGVVAFSLSGTVLASDFTAPEMTANQPGFNAAANAAMYAGRGMIGVVTYGNYHIRGVDANGQNVPSDLTLQVLLGTLHYNTDLKLFGGHYSFGATLVSGGLYPGGSERDMNDRLLDVSRNPWVTPIKLNWTLGEDWHIAANYTFRLGQTAGNTNTDKTYDIHQLGGQATWNINDHWQANFASSLEYRTKDLRTGRDMKPGTIGYFEGSLHHKFDNGMSLGGYAYHVRHLTDDKGLNDLGQQLGRYRSQLTGVGLEYTTPIEAIDSTLSVRLFTEPSRTNHMHGVRAFISVARKF
ncbi:hypothetical protein [Paraferrimonas sedimenticola]|uniref:Transporter n=1 Tax=Paraferrimonas sedimenticola TaxID=375674 RepID=A0AA37RYP4_9GAMM|nr:hypothetical protein [Paraferrimonas sedimenticola]GLP97613.1 hypothetical protein GCM10007895_29200 [Paraferrimonas sedimenticola]